MSFRRLFSLNRHSATDQASDRPPTYVSNVEAPPSTNPVRAWSARSSSMFSRSEADSEMYEESGELSLGCFVPDRG